MTCKVDCTYYVNVKFCKIFLQGPQILVTDSNIKTELEQALNKNTQLQQMLDKGKKELMEVQDQ